MSSTLKRRLADNPAAILLSLRDGSANDLETVIEALGVGPSYRAHVRNQIQILVNAGFLAVDEPNNLDEAKLRVTELLSRVQTSLNLSLKLLASAIDYNSMLIKPLFGAPRMCCRSL